jgi:hypothetical protein
VEWMWAWGPGDARQGLADEGEKVPLSGGWVGLGWMGWGLRGK